MTEQRRHGLDAAWRLAGIAGALEWFGFPPGHVPEQNAVAVAREALREIVAAFGAAKRLPYHGGRYLAEPPGPAAMADILDEAQAALAALGGEV